MACSIEGIQPEFVPNFLCSDIECDQLADMLVNEAALDELWRAQGFPTPPTSPERVYTPSQEPEDDDSCESDSSQDLPMLNELILLAYGEEVLLSNPVAVPTICPSPSTNLQDKLIQDCMWSSHVCCDRTVLSKKPPPPASLQLAAPRSSPPCGVAEQEGGGMYTPAPSPPPPPGGVVIGSDSSHDDEGMESDCVSPSVVFPSFLTQPATRTLPGTGSKVGATPVPMETNKPAPPRKSFVLRSKASVVDDPDWMEGDESGDDSCSRHGYERSQRRKRKLSTVAMGTGANSRYQPQSELSTSDEEIDVVTVTSTERGKLPPSRKRSHPLSSSSSSSSSQQASLHPQTKRKKYHTKRLQRLSSAGSNMENIESDDEARRASHNVLERKRRNDLKSSFQCLREEIPELEDNQRAPKVTILRKAMDYIRRMQEVEQAEETELAAERRRKAKLLERLNKLRAGCI